MQLDSLPTEPEGKLKITGVDSLPPLQQTQELSWGLLHCPSILYQLSYEGSPRERDKQLKISWNIYLLKTLNEVWVAKKIIVAFKMQNIKSNKKQKITIVERKKNPRVTLEIVLCLGMLG